MITDRDIAIAAATKGRLATEINVGEVISGNVYACVLDENVNSALKTMRRERVRRLPVIGSDGKLAGTLSINDIVLRAGEAKGKQAPEIPYMVLNASASLAPLASRSRYCSRTSNATSSWNRPTPNVPMNSLLAANINYADCAVVWYWLPAFKLTSEA